MAGLLSEYQVSLEAVLGRDEIYKDIFSLVVVCLFTGFLREWWGGCVCVFPLE